MVTMIDEIYDRNYRDGRVPLNSAIAGGFVRLGRAVANAFAVLNRIEYSEPWAAKPRKARSH
ncbi:MAG TPA: hypothetical protein VFW39_01025 [Sphingomicrobium sp.]|nr:hypothetical protein [Sphingomicrobium sp.]